LTHLHLAFEQQPANKRRFRCLVGCERQGWLHLSEAIRHEESEVHILNVREWQYEKTRSSSPFRMSSPGYDNVADPSPIPLPGPSLPSDPPDVIYNDWDNSFGQFIPQPDDDPESQQADPFIDIDDAASDSFEWIENVHLTCNTGSLPPSSPPKGSEDGDNRS